MTSTLVWEFIGSLAFCFLWECLSLGLLLHMLLLHTYMLLKIGGGTSFLIPVQANLMSRPQQIPWDLLWCLSPPPVSVNSTTMGRSQKYPSPSNRIRSMKRMIVPLWSKLKKMINQVKSLPNLSISRKISTINIYPSNNNGKPVKASYHPAVVKAWSMISGKLLTFWVKMKP